MRLSDILLNQIKESDEIMELSSNKMSMFVFLCRKGRVECTFEGIQAKILIVY